MRHKLEYQTVNQFYHKLIELYSNNKELEKN